MIKHKMAAAAVGVAVVIGGLLATAPASAATTAHAGATNTAAQAGGGQVVGIASLDVSRYLGDWYQYAAIPAIYEAQCARDSKAHYTLLNATTVGVRNTCTTWLGRTSAVSGEATVLNAPANSELNVAFVRIGGRYLHFGGPNYVVTAIGADYDWAVVGDPNHISGFVLSRTPALTADQLVLVRQAINDAGYSPSSFKLTPQTGGQSSRGSL